MPAAPPTALAPIVATTPAPDDTRAHAPVAADSATRPNTDSRRTTRSHALALAALAALVVAALALPRLPGQENTQRTADARGGSPEPPADRDSIAIATTPTVASAATSVAPPVVRSVAATRAVSEPAKKPTARLAANAAPVSTSRPEPVTPVVENRDKEDPAAAPASTEPASAAAAPPLVTESSALAPVTITGCLEISTDLDSFRLTDTEGAGVPKARSWRTGFLKKRSAPVDLVGLADTVTLQRQVGMRVAATGVLTSRELKVNAVRVVSSSCD